MKRLIIGGILTCVAGAIVATGMIGALFGHFWIGCIIGALALTTSALLVGIYFGSAMMAIYEVADTIKEVTNLVKPANVSGRVAKE
jgi:hypothetical protein